MKAMAHGTRSLAALSLSRFLVSGQISASSTKFFSRLISSNGLLP